MSQFYTNTRGQYSHTRNNKLFVNECNRLKKFKITEQQMADAIKVPHSTFNKTKLGYFSADSSIVYKLKHIADAFELEFDKNIEEQHNDSIVIQVPRELANKVKITFV